MATVTAEVRVDPGKLRRFVGLVLTDLGMSSNDAELAADVLVSTDLRGQHTHGVWYLPRYIQGIRGGGINPDAKPRTVQETPATAVLDGDGGLGALVMMRACAIAADKAGTVGCSTVAVRNSNHFGAASHYTLWLAERGMIGLIVANSLPAMTGPGGKARMLGTQPLSYAAADPDGQGAVMLDMALSLVAGTRVSQARDRGESIPEGWIVDPNGQPTTEPADFFAGGALLPLAGHKGYALAIFAEILSGVLSGAGVTHGVRSHDPVKPSDTGHCVIAINVSAFMASEEFATRLAALRAEIHAAPVIDGGQHAILPGEPEYAHERESRINGLELDRLIWQALKGVATDLGREADLEQARA